MSPYSYQLICLISQLILIASRRDWYWLKGLFKGFQVPLRLWELSKNWCRCQGRVEWERSYPGMGGIWQQNVREQPWPQLVRCASIDCRACGCVFQKDWIVVRSLGEEWYRLIGVRIGQGEDVNDFNLRTKELGCDYWSTYTKSGIGGVQVTSLHRDPIGVDNRSLGAKN